VDFASEDFEDNVVAKVVRVASIAMSTKKRTDKAAKEALKVAHIEMKRK